VSQLKGGNGYSLNNTREQPNYSAHTRQLKPEETTQNHHPENRSSF
jgi:hypothetical protein